MHTSGMHNGEAPLASPLASEGLVRWYLNEADGDACGLQAAAWNHTEEVTATSEVSSGPRLALALRPSRSHGSDVVHVGAQSRAYHEVDVYPERSGWARARLRQVHAAWTRLPSWAQAVLEARFAHDGGRRPTVPGCAPVGRVVELLREVREVASEQKLTPREACIVTSLKARQGELVLQAEAAVAEALGLFSLAWAGASSARVSAFRARLVS